MIDMPCNEATHVWLLGTQQTRFKTLISTIAAAQTIMGTVEIGKVKGTYHLALAASTLFPKGPAHPAAPTFSTLVKRMTVTF